MTAQSIVFLKKFMTDRKMTVKNTETLMVIILTQKFNASIINMIFL